MSEVRKDRPEDVPPEDRGPRYGRRGYGDDEGAWAWWWWVLGIIVIGLIIWWIVAAATPRAPERVVTGPTYGTGGQVAPGAVTIPAILGNPNQYMGRVVNVRGVVGQVFGTNAFVLQSQGAANAQQGLLIVGQDQIVQSVRSGQSVQVTGTVHRFNAAAVQPGTAGQQLQRWQNRPAIQASAVTITSAPA
jgi:predicted extracellular nuclease